MSAQQFGQENVLQGARLRSTEGIEAANRQSAIDRQMAADRAAHDRALADNAAAKERLGIQMTSEERRAKETIAADDARHARIISAEDARVARSDTEAWRRNEATNLANTESAKQDRAAKQQAAMMENINIANATYNQALTAIHNNENIPADVATRMAINAAAIRDGSLNMFKQVSNVDFHWSSPAISPPPTAQPATTTDTAASSGAGSAPGTTYDASDFPPP